MKGIWIVTEFINMALTPPFGIAIFIFFGLTEILLYTNTFLRISALKAWLFYLRCMLERG